MAKKTAEMVALLENGPSALEMEHNRNFGSAQPSVSQEVADLLENGPSALERALDDAWLQGESKAFVAAKQGFFKAAEQHSFKKSWVQDTRKLLDLDQSRITPKSAS